MTDKELKKITYNKDTAIDAKSILNLYNDAGWTAYTNTPETLIQGISNSLTVYYAWEEKKLVALLRIIGDGSTIIYIQDILVLKKFRRMGIGKNLIKMVLSDYNHVRQVVLLTDISDTTDSFYTSCGFSPAEDAGCRSYTILKGD